MESSQEKNSNNPKWLKKIQENSWEAEILISGGALFSIFQLRDFVVDFRQQVSDLAGPIALNEVFIFSHLALNGLIIGFVCHLVVRSIWIGIACLKKVIPHGINMHQLPFTPKYVEDFRSFDLGEQSLKLDRLSGILFFSSISFVLMILGMILITLVGTLLILVSSVLFRVFFSFLLVFLVDMLSMGLLRRWRLIAKLYRPIYMFFEVLSLSIIYRPWLLVLSTNVKRWKLFVSGILFLVLSLVLTRFTSSTTMGWVNPMDERKFNEFSEVSVVWTQNFYENRCTATGENRVKFVSIQDDIVSDKFLRVFIPYFQWYDQFIEQANATKLSMIVVLELDGRPVDQLEWIFGKNKNQVGITSYLPIDHLSQGKHTLTVHLKNVGWPFPLQIPFWKQ